MIPPKWIDATDLNLWAYRKDSQARLPQLLRRLIHSTVQRLQRIGFPAGESVQMGGWDGIVETPQGNTFVPDGYSVWELGVDKGVKGKADKDYQKRCTDPLGLIPGKTTFIFVTSRRWGGKNKWIKQKNLDRIWAEVRAYDADDLEQWLELAPAVHTWLAQLIGKWSEDTQDLGSFWDEWVNTTSPSLTTSLHINGREKSVENVTNWLQKLPKLPSKLTIQADSSEEAIAFFAAVIHEMPENERVQYLSRCVLIKNESSWRYFGNIQDPLKNKSSWRYSGNIQNPLILIPVFSPLTFIPTGHHTLVPIGKEISPSKETLRLSCLDRASFRQGLLNMGFSEERAYALSKESKRSLLVLRRLIARDPEIHTPDWAKPDNARWLIPALLAGAWNDDQEADREALAALARQPYEEVITNVSRWLNSSDPPIRKTGNIWQLVSREVTWYFLCKFLVSNDFEAFKKVALSVLETLDPKYELPPDQRSAASLYGKELPHSGFLSRGLAETLAILSTRDLTSKIQDINTSQSKVDFIVYHLLNTNCNWQRWASLSYLLPILAEAAPDIFLNAVEQGLTGECPTLINIFQESIWGDSPHIGLLWALETLAWKPTYFSQVALILGKLSRLDPGGKLANRPFNSLYHIFLCWYPQTLAPLQQRLRVIDTLLKREPEIAWKFLLKLLPEISGGIADPTHQPRWRDWNSNYDPNVTISEYLQSIKALVDRIISSVGTNNDKWCDVINCMDSLSPEFLDLIINALDKVDTSQMQPFEIVTIWSSLRKIIHKHREFPEASWAMSQETVDKLDSVYQKFQPNDLIYGYSWIFKIYPEFITSIHQSYEVNQIKVEKVQLETATQIYVKGGITTLVELANHVKEPRLLGLAIAKIETITESEVELLERTLEEENPALNDLAVGFVIGRMKIAGWNWVEETLQTIQDQQWSSQKIINYFTGLPFEKRTWELLGSFSEEVQKLYWRTIVARLVCENDCEIAIRQLLKVNRPYYALELANSFLISDDKSDLLPPELLIEILKKAALVNPEHEISQLPTAMINYYIERCFHILDKLASVEKNEIANLEWIYLSLLIHSERQPKYLHQKLSEEPLFFAEILKFIYRLENEIDEIIEFDETQAILFKKVYKLLDSWHQIPGLNEEGQVDYTKLKDWVLTARKTCKQEGRGKIADHEIGKVLAYSPQGLDGIWPDVAVREIIDEISSDNLEKGIEIGVYNKRGVWIKSVGEGGTQERQLSETYRNYAAEIVDSYLRTASMLRRISNSYESEGHREDIRSELED